MAKKMICITMDEKTWKKARQLATEENRTLSNYLSFLVLREKEPEKSNLLSKI